MLGSSTFNFLFLLVLEIIQNFKNNNNNLKKRRESKAEHGARVPTGILGSSLHISPLPPPPRKSTAFEGGA